MKTEQQYFESAISMAEYMDQMLQLKNESFTIYNKFQVPTDDGFVEKLKDANLHILAITEFWCGDAMLNNPIMRKIAEAADTEIRAVFRDDDTSLIDRYLTNGGRSIPIYLFLNEAGEVVTKWGPRAPELQEMVVEGRKTLPPEDDPSFAEEQKKLYSNMQTNFVQNENLWTYVYDSIKETVEPIL